MRMSAACVALCCFLTLFYSLLILFPMRVCVLLFIVVPAEEMRKHLSSKCMREFSCFYMISQHTAIMDFWFFFCFCDCGNVSVCHLAHTHTQHIQCSNVIWYATRVQFIVCSLSHSMPTPFCCRCFFFN